MLLCELLFNEDWVNRLVDITFVAKLTGNKSNNGRRQEDHFLDGRS